MKILVAEDDAVSGAILKAQLIKLGHDPVLKADGAAAFAYFQAEPTDVVISDWIMPGLNGLALCTAIRNLQLRNYTHFVLQTTNTSEANYQEAMAKGVDDFLPKPISRVELYNRLRVAERMIRQRSEANRKIELLARFPEDNPNPVLQLNREAVVLYANAAAAKCLVSLNGGVGQTAPPKLRGLIQQLFVSGNRQEIELAFDQRIFSFAATSVLDPDSTYLYGHDITDRKKAEFEIIRLKDEAMKLALHDQLTGLPNRVQLTTRLEQARAQARRHRQSFALLMIDIDNFKSVNDGLGHDAGDRLIILVAHTLQKQLRGTDTICRWGGDEMVVLLTELREAGDVAAVCGRMSQAVKAAVAQGNFNAPISISIGYSLFPEQGEDLDILMQQADQALYDAKRAGRNCWRLFTEFSAGEIKQSAANLLFRLGNAVREDRLTVHYQPLIDGRTGQPVSLEALARWQDEELGRVPPDLFIPLAEEKGLIVELGRQVLHKSMAATRDWRAQGWPITVAVNVSRQQLMQEGFADSVAETAQAQGIAPATLILEITEREALADHVACRQNLERLALHGFRLSLDDFGSGYSTFELLCELPFQELKLNMGLIQRLDNPRVVRVVQSIVDLGRSLDLVIVAEGIETEEQRAFLTGIGVHKLQGYLFSKPLEASAFGEYLRSFPAAASEAAA